VVTHKDGRAIAAEAAECERLVGLFPNAFKHRTEIGVRWIETKLRHGDPEIERIVTTVETSDLRPGDFRPIFK
jgi:hypothetical protein